MSANTATKELKIKEEIRSTEDAVYTYILSSRPGERVASYGLTLYSVEIKMTDKLGKQSFSKLEDIFSDFKRALRFYNKLVKNLATPIDLPYVFEDELE